MVPGTIKFLLTHTSGGSFPARHYRVIMLDVRQFMPGGRETARKGDA